jgi:hypothetical protein
MKDHGIHFFLRRIFDLFYLHAWALPVGTGRDGEIVRSSGIFALSVTQKSIGAIKAIKKQHRLILHG